MRIVLFCRFILLAFLSGCATTTFQYGETRFSRTSFGTTASVGEFEILMGEDGARYIRLGRASTDQTGGLEAAARGVTEGAIHGLLP